jgi:hypothetical protein
VLVALNVPYSHLSDDSMTIADWALVALVLFSLRWSGWIVYIAAFPFCTAFALWAMA